MYLVFKDKYGDIKWEDKFEVESMESFVSERNERLMKMGAKMPLLGIESPFKITELDWDFKLKGTYHPCEKDINRFASVSN